eukprot:PITA_14508
MLNSLLPGWAFTALDASGHSGGLAIGIKECRVKILSHWGLKNVLGMEVLSPDFPIPLTIVNVYGPCQSRVSFWDDLLSKSVMNNPMMILGGDLNFSLGRNEAWGPSAREDPFAEFFLNLFSENNLIDPAPVKLKPTWRNKRVGDQREATITEVFKTVQSFPRFVEEDEAEDLLIPVTKEEVEVAMKLMGKDKSPGPDGWTIELFLHFFEQIGAEITEVVEESKQKGVIYRPFNSTFIALIPKKDDPESFEDFRPISLCNCIYKIISKVIALRIGPILSRNISMEQFAFLNGRQIHEAIGVAQEVTHSIKVKKKKGVVLKIDLSKAYDRIN